jgi:hypothetical protein
VFEVWDLSKILLDIVIDINRIEITPVLIEEVIDFSN